MTNKEQYQLAAQLLQMDIKEIEELGGIIDDISALYVSVPEKGGASLIVGSDGSVLYADSSIGYSSHVEAFKNGTRTPIDAFKANE